MNILNELETRYGPEYRYYASQLNEEEEYKRIVDVYQKRWDDGITFMSEGMAALADIPRKEDSAEELDACCLELRELLGGEIKRWFINSLTRDEITTLDKIMSKMDCMAHFVITDGIKFDKHDLILIGDETHHA